MRLAFITLGIFAADVSLQKVMVDGGGGLITWNHSLEKQGDTDLSVSRVSHANGSHSYQLQMPLSHPQIIPEVRMIELFYDLSENV